VLGPPDYEAGVPTATFCGSTFYIVKPVRFQVLTAASMMFRVVFWDILLIPDDGGSTHL
jgi:hypothetical protein